MRTRFRFIALQAFAIFCLSFCSSRVVGQSPAIEVTHILAPVNQLSISDLDFRNSTTPKWLFTITIRVLDGSTTEDSMQVRAGFALPDGSRYDPAVEFTTRAFTVSGIKSISNLDLDRTIRLASYSVRGDAKRRLEQEALPTGQIPAGTYFFEVQVFPVGGGQSASTSFSISLTNPTTVELISPIDGDQFVNPFPLFQWLYDGPSSRISVFEKLVGQASLEEAASGIPHYSTTVATNSLQYPSSGARILEPGKTYVWFVEGLVGSAGGTTVGRKSDLRSFIVASMGSQSFSSILDELARALPQYQALFDDLKTQGFTNPGTLRLNGSVISVSDLQQLLNTLRLNPDAVTSVELE